jgi:tetratricopeptide (TPR) repeat protein
MPTDDVLKQWNEILRQAARRMQERDLSGAVAIIDRCLESRPVPEIKARALAFRAELKCQLGESADAKTDYEAAFSMEPGDTYHRYTVAIALGALSEQQGSPEDAAAWYTRALREAEVDESEMGGLAIQKLVALRKGNLSIAEKQACVTVAAKAWRAAGLPGTPDFENLSATAEAIVAAGTSPRSTSGGR